MQVIKFAVILVLVCFVGHCIAAKLPKHGAKNLKKSQLKHHPKRNKAENFKNLKDKKIWSEKSVVVQPAAQRNDVFKTQFTTNPLLDQLFEQRYHAMEEVDKITNKINYLMQRQYNQKNNYANAVSTFANPGSLSSSPYGVQGGSFVPGPADAASVAGANNAQLRQLAVKMSKNYVNSGDNAPLDMPQPMDDSENGSPNSTLSDDDELSEDTDDHTDLGDPKKFDSVCSVLKLTFEHTNGAMILDDSFKFNNAKLEDGAYVSNTGSRSGTSAIIGDDGYVGISDKFNGKPKSAAAISMWVNLRSVDGVNPLFQASDRNGTTHYDLSVVNGSAIWIHRNDTDQEIFNVKADNGSHFTADKWHHIVGVYSSKFKKATLWLDGKEIGHQEGVTGELSQDWTKIFMFEGKTTGFADNVFMFRCSLDKTKVIALYVASASPKHI